MDIFAAVVLHEIVTLMQDLVAAQVAFPAHYFHLAQVAIIIQVMG
jgi:hypothetical protein